ncbi:MAG: indolepyruvate oxidoreductase subunit beta [Candidatus Cloacimonadota bacterium]|nr:indolepyruvate oxidoreductase subunit beta [Candidatus Cloacimonadota bacterium]
MKIDIILAGVGGQGILSIATIIGYAALESGLYLKQAEVHGMSQRGGDVQSHLRISDIPIQSDLIPEGNADLILSVEPMEALRYMPYLSEKGWLVTNSNPYVNIPDYPNKEDVYKEIKAIKNHVLIDADAEAKAIGSARSMNMVILGAASLQIELPFELLEKGIEYIFGRKGEKVVSKNIEAINLGRNLAKDYS